MSQLQAIERSVPRGAPLPSELGARAYEARARLRSNLRRIPEFRKALVDAFFGEGCPQQEPPMAGGILFDRKGSRYYVQDHESSHASSGVSDGDSVLRSVFFRLQVAKFDPIEAENGLELAGDEDWRRHVRQVAGAELTGSYRETHSVGSEPEREFIDGTALITRGSMPEFINQRAAFRRMGSAFPGLYPRRGR